MESTFFERRGEFLPHVSEKLARTVVRDIQSGSSPFVKLNNILETKLPSESIPHFTQTISIEQFQMLEAELQNRGILPSATAKELLLSHLLTKEVSVWKWRARRRGVTSIDFRVNVPRFLLSTFEGILMEIDSESSSEVADEQRNLDLDKTTSTFISYLGVFAEFVVEVLTKPEDKPQDVVLRTLLQGSTNSSPKVIPVLEVPFTRDNFEQALKVNKD